ncbi:MAG: hypothetical protein H2184_15645 [Candidatus Galacturonibacter soehngenii]|nr:hypothetical protein [Candidatus Galacturonibacter soehngenii]
MEHEEAIKILENQVDKLKNKLTNEYWSKLVVSGNVLPTNEARTEHIANIANMILANEVAIKELNKSYNTPMLIYQAEVEEELYTIEEIHSHLDVVLLEEGIKIKKSTLLSNDEECIHDGNQKCRVCGCNFFHACPGGCWWIEDDLCSSCNYKIKYKRNRGA